MGLLDLGSEILVEVRGDVSDIKAKLKELQGAEKELAQQQLEAAEKRNEGLDGWVEKLGKVSLGIIAVKEIAETAFDGYKEALQESKLKTASFGVDLEGLSRAAGGLKTEMELLTFAAKANNSAFNNTQEDMETAERAIRKLEARGVPTADAIDAITNAVVGAKVKGLVPLGIVVDSHIDKLANLGEENLTAAQKTEVHTAAMKSLREFTKDSSDEQDNLGDSMKRSEVKLQEAWAGIKKGLGQLALEMQPLLEALASAVGLVGKIAKAAGLEGDEDTGTGAFGTALHYGVSASKWINPTYQMYRGVKYIQGDDLNIQKLGSQAAGTAAHGLSMDDAISKGISQGTNQYIAAADQASQKASFAGEFEITEDDVKKVEEANKKAIAEYKKVSEEQARNLAEWNKKIWNIVHDGSKTNLLPEGGGGSTGQRADVGNDNLSLIDTTQLLNKQQADLTKDWQTRLAAAQKSDAKWMEKVFGSPEDFQLYKKLFDTVSGAIGSMYDTIVSGQGSASDAFKKVVASSVEAIGKEMLIQSLKETGLAVASLASYDYAGAAKHGEAAGLFAAGAVAAGVAAHELGFGGGSSSSGGGAPSSMGGGGGNPIVGNATQTQRNATIVIGDSFADESPRMRQLKAEKLVAKALGGSGGKNS